MLVQYYNNEMEMAVWYLRVILGGTNVLVDPFQPYDSRLGSGSERR